MCLVSSLELVLAPVPPQVWLVALLAVVAEVLMPNFGSHRRTLALAVVAPVVMEVSIEYENMSARDTILARLILIKNAVHMVQKKQ